jgi:glutathione-regulated potassium-efflux system ancillary protein KefC
MGDQDMLFNALVYLGAAVVCVPIVSRLGLGSVLGYLVAGCIIGPHALGLITNVASILHFAEIGVVLMLFLIGLELDPKRLWEMRRAVFGAGTFQMLACALPFALIGMAVGLSLRAAIVAGLALSLSSTAIAVQTMNERNLLRSPLGRTSFGVLLFQDLAAIPIMGLIPFLGAKKEGAHFEPIEAAKALLAIVLVVGVGRYLLRPMLRAIARTNLREVFTAFALLLVLGIAEVMALVHLSMALGAFLAGVLLAGSEFRHALVADIEPFKGLLMGLFFIAVGMSMNFPLLADHPATLAGLVLGFLVVKGLVLALVAGRIEAARSERWLFAALLGQGGEFAFVVFGVAREARALPGEWDAMLTLVVALSMAATPFLLIAYDRSVARAAERSKEPADAIEHDDAEVIIAGFGRFGQIVGRLLFASGIRATVLDHDPQQIEILRRFGFRIFYGDATRIDLLEAAGAGRAKLLVNAIDDIDDNLELVDAVREHFPAVPILARARNVSHYLALRERGVTSIERETFEAAIAAGRKALEALGVARFEARERADRFRRQNLRNLEALFPDAFDETRRLSMAKAARAELLAQFEKDRLELERASMADWEAEALDAADEERMRAGD